MCICICICICASLYTLPLRRVRLHCGFLCLVSSSSTSSLFIFSAEFWLQTIFNFIAFPSTHPPSLFLFQLFLLVFFVLQKQLRLTASATATLTSQLQRLSDSNSGVGCCEEICFLMWGDLRRNCGEKFNWVWVGGVEELWGESASASASAWISFWFIYSLCFCFSL